MNHSPRNDSLRHDALAIWTAAIDAVRSDRLVQQAVRTEGDTLFVNNTPYPLGTGRLLVVGAGKAGGGMAVGLEAALGDTFAENRREGWINVPADCVRPAQWIHLHAARPPGLNEPTSEAVAGTQEILRRVESLDENDICLVLISGGGSALLCAPTDGVTLDDKVAITRQLAAAGASIDELNTVRRRLSDVKGGGLLQHCQAGRVLVLIISDVIGDPLETIASGPTVRRPVATIMEEATRAREILERLIPETDSLPRGVLEAIERGSTGDNLSHEMQPHVEHFILGNNRTALEAAAAKAETLGYHVLDVRPEEGGEAADVGRSLAEEARAVRAVRDPVSPGCCLITGGEPVVRLGPSTRPRKGGRNQEVALAAIEHLWDDGMPGVVILSGGTDGEDGPTDAAGAIADAAVIQQARDLHLRPHEFLVNHNAYPFFEQTGGLIQTGPTQTNVMDVRVVVVHPGERPADA